MIHYMLAQLTRKEDENTAMRLKKETLPPQ